LNKKLLYGFLIISLLATTAVRPVLAADYTFGVPDAAKGITGESRINIYDGGIWGATVFENTTASGLFGGDAGVLNAQAKSLIKNWAEANDQYFLRVADGIEIDGDSLWSMLNEGNTKMTTSVAPMLGLIYGILALNSSTAAAATLAAATQAGLGTRTETYVKANYANTTAVMLLTRDKWDYKDGAYAADPDETDNEAPFITDPADVIKVAELKDVLVADLTANVSVIGGLIVTAYGQLMILPNDVANVSADPTYIGTCMAVYGFVPSCTDVMMGMLTEMAAGMMTISNEDVLVGVLMEGMPIYIPVGTFLDKVIADYNISTITAADGVVTIAMAKGHSNLILGNASADYTIEIVYGDKGSQSSITFKDGDGTIFFKSEGLMLIPGYDLAILLAISAISMIGLIYTINKRKR